MLFQINKTLSEEDYLAYNIFQATESPYGKRMIRKRKIAILIYVATILLLVAFWLGWTTFAIIYVAAFGLLTLLYILLLKKLVIRSVKAQIKQLKKTGKSLFTPTSTLEFYEDYFVEISPSVRSEQKYAAIERIYVVKDRYIFMYFSSTGAYVLPIVQIKEQIDQEEFMAFLSRKCANIEYY